MLRGLRQREKSSGHDAARHQKITRPFRRALRQNWRFNFHEALAVEVVARCFCGPMANPQIAREAWPTQIQITMRHPQIFILRLGIERERQRVGTIQNPQLVRDDFNVAGREVWIFRAGRTCGDRARNLNNIFAAQRVRLLSKLGIFLRTKNHLGQSLAVAQINENHTAVVAGDIYPSGKRDLPADIAFVK